MMKVRFRVMKVKPTDFENAAFAAFYRSLAFAKLDADLTTPLSGHNSNTHKAQMRDAVMTRSSECPVSSK